MNRLRVYRVGPMPHCEQPGVTHLHANRIVRGSKILIIDDCKAVRCGVRAFLENRGFQVCGEAADGVEGIEKAKTLKPDLIVLDLAMPRMNGVEVASILSQTMPSIPIIMFTLYEEFVGSSLAAATGIKAVVSKTEGLDKLVACVRSLL